MTTDLTFAELRLATLLNADKPVVANSPILPDLTDILKTDKATLERALADMVIVADDIAATAGIDLAAAIRKRFDPTESSQND
jgi:hypothetical protein